MAKRNFTLVICTTNLKDKAMRKVIAVFTALSFLVLPVPANAASPKAGATCTKINQSQNVNGYKFTCLKSGKKLVWSSGSKITKPAFEFSSVCDIDPDSPKEWAATERFLSFLSCTSMYKYVPYSMSDMKPMDELTAASGLANIEDCKIKQPSNQYYPWRGFADPSDQQMTNYYNLFASPRPNMIIQVMPISWPDLPYAGNPQTDYGHYLKFFEEWIKNSADNGSDITVRIPDKYYPMPKTLDSYKDIEKHGQPTPDRKIFWSDAVAATDAGINFTGTTLAIVVPAPNTPIAKFGGNPDGRGNRSSEGMIPDMMSVPPINLKEAHTNSQLATPHMWMHEMSHAGLDIGDYYYSGIWGSVGSGQIDQLGWDKYIEGFMNDAQIRCAPVDKTTTHWIVPSVAKGPYQKLVVVPLSKTKVIIVESMRSAGYNYKLPKNSQGALVYTVDVSKTAHGEGTEVYRPANRSFEPVDGRKSDAALKKGESITISGVKISVINTGTFGDVIKVEKV